MRDFLARLAKQTPEFIFHWKSADTDHFFVDYTGRNPAGVPQDPRVHVSIAHGVGRAFWQRGSAWELVGVLVEWAQRLGWDLRLESRLESDELGRYREHTWRVYAPADAQRARRLLGEAASAESPDALLRALSAALEVTKRTPAEHEAPP